MVNLQVVRHYYMEAQMILANTLTSLGAVADGSLVLADETDALRMVNLWTCAGEKALADMRTGMAALLDEEKDKR